MAKVVIGAEVKVEGLDRAGQSVGAFKKQLKDAQLELEKMTDKFGDTSKEAAAAAQNVALIRDKIGDAKSLVETFNPDKKFVALGGAIQGVVAGFSTAIGAMGLFGDKGKEIEEVMLKVQSAMALQQGISGLAQAADSFKLLANTVKGSVVKAFTTLRGALIATGIGALIVGIGLVISNFDSLKKFILNLFPGLSKLADLVGSVVNWFTDLIGVTSDAQRAHEKYIAAVEKSVQSTQDFLDSQGDKFDEFTNRKFKAKLEYNKKILELDKDETRSEAEKQALLREYGEKANREIRQAEEDRKSKQEKDTKDAADKIQAANDKAAAARKKDQDDKDADGLKEKELQQSLLLMKIEGLNKERDAIEAFGAELVELDEAKAEGERQRLRDNQEKMLETKAELAELALLDDPDSIDNKILKIQADLELELAALAEGDLRRQILTKQASDAIVKIKAEEAEAKKLISEKELAQQNYVVDQVANGLETLAGIAGKQTAAGKALSIASTVIKTIQGGIAAFTGMVSNIPGPVGIALGVVAAAGVVAAGVKAVKQITAVKIPGASGGGGGAPSISLPSAPIQPQAQTTTLDQGSINAVGNAASRAYVLETDVSGNQERIRRLNRAARIN